MAYSSQEIAREKMAKAKEEEMNSMAKKSVLRTIREFSDEPVTDDEIIELLTGAFDAANARNRQYYSVIAISNDETKRKLNEMTNPHHKFISKAPKILLFCIDHYRENEAIRRAGFDYDIDRAGLFSTSFVDVILLAQRFLELAWQKNIGGVFIGAIQNNLFTLQEILGIEEGVYPVAMLCIGRFGELPPKKKRLPPELLIHFERYDKSLVEKYLELYPPDKDKSRRLIEHSEESSARGRTKTVAELFERYLKKER